MSGLLLRRAEPDDAAEIATLYRTVYDDRYSLAEYTDPPAIEERLATDDWIWFVASQDCDLVGSAVAVPDAWNDSFEIGRTITARASAGRHVAASLCAMVRATAFGRHAVGWATLRNYPIYRISRRDGMVLCGYLPGVHDVAGRETHLLCLSLSPAARRRRVGVPGATFYDEEPIAGILAEMGLDRRRGPYPAAVLVGPAAGPVERIEGRYVAGDQAWIVAGSTDYRALVPEYVEVSVLADKAEAMAILEAGGFRRTAFLPGWYEEGGRRYDCFRLVRCRRAPATVGDARLDALLEPFLRLDRTAGMAGTR